MESFHLPFFPALQGSKIGVFQKQFSSNSDQDLNLYPDRIKKNVNPIHYFFLLPGLNSS